MTAGCSIARCATSGASPPPNTDSFITIAGCLNMEKWPGCSRMSSISWEAIYEKSLHHAQAHRHFGDHRHAAAGDRFWHPLGPAKTWPVGDAHLCQQVRL